MSVHPRRGPRRFKPKRGALVLALAATLTGAFFAVFMHRADAVPASPVAGASSITFDHPNIVDPVRLVGEPDIAIDSYGNLYASGPGSSPTQSSHFWKSEDHGVNWHYVGIIPEEKSNGGLGGGDTELMIDAHDTVWGMDQEGLACNAHFRSTNGGHTWSYSQGCGASTDRPWMDTYTDPAGNTTSYFVANGQGLGCYMLKSNDGVVWTPAIKDSTTPTPVNGTGGTCTGRMTIDQRNGTLYVPVGGDIRKSTDGGQTWTTAGTTGAHGGAGQGGMATVVSDADGNLYQAWTNLSSMMLAVSKNGGVTWTKTAIPNPTGMTRSIFVWPVVGDPGRIAIAYYATSDVPTSTSANWRTYIAFSTNALDAAPTFATVIADEHYMKVGTVCLSGTTCVLNAATPAAGDRTLADFFMLDVDPNDGRVYIIYNDDGENSPQSHVGAAYVGVIRQRTGPSLKASVGNLPLPTTRNVSIGSATVANGNVQVQGTHGLPAGNFSLDPAGDAVYPWAPVTGNNVPAMDIREASVGDDGTNLVFKIKVADLSAGAVATATDVAGVPSWVVTWFANQPGVAPPNQQARFFVKWLGGSQFVYGKTNFIDMAQLGAPAPKFVTFVPSGTADGTVNGNEITIKVPASAVGNPNAGDKLDSVTAWTWSERGEIPTVVDAAQAFSYRYKTPVAQQHAPDGVVDVSIDDSTFASPTRIVPSSNGAWSASLADPSLAGHHTIYVRQLLTSSLHQTAWPDVLAGPVDTFSFRSHVPKVSVANASVTEGTGADSTANVTVSLSEPSTDDITVNYKTSDGTAVDAGDYSAETGSISIPAGKSSGTIAIKVNGDGEPEPNETFSVVVTGANNATVGDATAVVTISNDDGAMGCTITGTAGNDTLVGTKGNDVICGLGGNDAIRGGTGNDVLIGGAGNDVIYGEDGTDTLRGQEGDDTLDGGRGADKIVAYTGKDTLLGQAGTDSLNAKDGVGDDTADGGSERDTCVVDPGDVVKSCP